MKPGRTYHFEAFGAVWSAKLERAKNAAGEQDTRVFWACVEHLEGPHGGMSDGSLESFGAWFKLYGRLPPLEPPSAGGVSHERGITCTDAPT
ncbi:MAG: hypothetical protein HC933_06340 [Pleurocapsa sp. SU_196_0]|nr:hypothetical protein [Pleurocapsa sp. SU_196_0]